MKSKKAVLLTIGLIVILIAAALLCRSVFFAGDRSTEDPENTEQEEVLPKTTSWISEDNGEEHTETRYPLGTDAKAVSEVLPPYMKLEHKFIDDIPIYEMYQSDLRNGSIIFFLHGQMGNKESYLYQMIDYAEEGYLCVSIDLEGHGERITDEKIMSAQITTDTGKDIDTLIQYYSTKDYADETYFALYGLSQGGSVVYWYTAFGEHTPKAIITGCATPDCKYHIDTACIQNGEFTEPIWDEETLENYIAENNPISRVERFYSIAIMSGNSYDDTVVSYKGAEELEKQLKDAGNSNISFHYFDDVGHSVTNEFVYDTIPFLKNYL